MSRSATTVVLLLCATTLRAQAPLDTARALSTVANQVVVLGKKHGDSVWPGYRPDTIPIAYVLPAHGTLLFNWHGAPPVGYSAVPEIPNAFWRDERNLGAASTGTLVDGRRVAQVAIGTAQPLEEASVLATTFHEAFHVFERVNAHPGKKFGSSENSMLVSSYPVFDANNEAMFALEGRILSAALDAKDGATARRLAGEFAAVRRTRHLHLPPDYAQFDVMSELNEGLANYALARALGIIVADGPVRWRPSARRQLATLWTQLRDVTSADNLSPRYRYYVTGPAESLLLDRIAGPSWKRRLIAEDATLQDLLASASGIDAPMETALREGEAAFGGSDARAVAQQRIAKLQQSRLAKVDSVLSGPGIRLVLAADSLPGRDFNSCGFDPQNELAVTETVRIQMRWWKPCAGGPTNAEFNVPSVHDETAGTISAMIGAEGDVHLTAAGTPVVIRDGETLRDLKTFKLEAPRASVDAARADVVRRGNVITVYPKRGS